jgi:hypothetical protein
VFEIFIPSTQFSRNSFSVAKTFPAQSPKHEFVAVVAFYSKGLFTRVARFFVAKPSRTQLFHERSSEPDRGGFSFLCQEQSTDKISLSALVALARHLEKCKHRQDVI